MRVDTLEAYDVPSEILGIWQSTVGPELLPVQERAVKEFGLFGDSNLVVFSPTSSGKTFVGEMAAVRAARKSTKVFYLVPQKALAEEKYEELRGRYEHVGIKVVVSSRDHREYDTAIERRDFQIAVVVFEKMQALLVSRPQIMEAVGLVVVDELQVLTDEKRGPTLELLLTKLKLAGSKPRIVGLSAVLGKAELVANWLGARLLVDTRRPVELRKGVFCQGVFTYLEHNSGVEGTETFGESDATDRQALLLQVTEYLVKRGEQVLVFVPDRAATVALSKALAGRVALPPLEAARDELREQEDTQAREALREVLGSSVAFHNSDLSTAERRLVETHFRDAGIRVLVSTSTLAMGMNLPVRNVVMDGQKWQFLKRYDRWSLEDISKSEYENMSGRAGRLGFGRDFGRSILVTTSPFEARVWLRHYVQGDFEEVTPTLGGAPLENHVVDLLASGMAHGSDELRAVLMASFTGTTEWAPNAGGEEFRARLERAVATCVSGGLARLEPAGRLTATDLGHACAAKGIGAATTAAMAEWCNQARTAALSPLEILTAVSLTPAGRDVYVTLSNPERRRSDYRAELLRKATDAGVVDRPLFAQMGADQTLVDYETAKGLKKALLLSDWVEEVGTRDIERRYRVWAGSVQRLGEEYAWLVEALGAVAEATGWPEARAAELTMLSDRLRHGMRVDGLGVARLGVRGLGRGLVRRLVAAGFVDAESMRRAGAEAVRKALGHKRVFGSLWAKIGQSETTAPAEPYPETGDSRVLRVAEGGPESPVIDEPAPDSGPALVVDLEALRVTYRGHVIPTRPPNNLQRQRLLALAVLAGRPGEIVTMAEIAEGMFKLGGLRKRPVAPDAKDLRHKMFAPVSRPHGVQGLMAGVTALPTTPER